MVETMEVGSVASFVRQAFPFGTIPVRTPGKPERPLDDYSFNYSKWLDDRQAVYVPDDQERWTSPPMWPPDAFALAAQLLEQSGAYLRMAYDNKTPPSVCASDAWPVDVTQFLELRDIQENALPQNLAIPAPLVKVCRILGSLWAEGMLFLSWSTFDDGSAIDGKKICQLQRNRFDDFLSKTHLRYASEFVFDEIENVIKCIISFENKRYNEGRQTHRTALSALLRKRMPELAQLASTDPQTSIELFKDILEAKRELETCKICLWALDFLQSIWSVINNQPCQIAPSSEIGRQDWKWWPAAALLMIISDEAGKSLGFSLLRPNGLDDTLSESISAEVIETVDTVETAAIRDGQTVGLSCRDIWLAYTKRMGEGRPEKQKRQPRTTTRAFNDNIAAVLPKARTPATGCTIRSLSHNLAMLPPKGRVRARWAQQAAARERSAYNILLIPFPYNIYTKDVVPANIDADGESQSWGRFDLKPVWMSGRFCEKTGSRILDEDESIPSLGAKEAFWRFVESLLLDQPQDIVNAIVIPEAALDWKTFSLLQERIISNSAFQSIDLLVAGLIEDGTLDETQPKRGNFVATYVRHSTGTHSSSNKWAVQDVRAKHHRWSLNKEQLKTYALSNVLAPDRVWWENITLPPREMLFAEFSCGSIVTSLICEDLARIEPCQVALRAVGPNLTLVLLMDSAQIVGRWPSQYAGVLADDPGTSVLTLTSFGLVKRANLSEGYDSRAIALWREPYGCPARQINLPKGYHAQLLSIRKDTIRETTIDGRGDNGDCAIVWRYSGLVPIKSKYMPPGGGADDG